MAPKIKDTFEETVPDHASTKEEEDKIRAQREQFSEWCAKVGIKFPKVDYPAFFEGGLVGGKVNAPI